MKSVSPFRPNLNCVLSLNLLNQDNGAYDEICAPRAPAGRRLVARKKCSGKETHLLEAPRTAGVHSQTLLACAGTSGGADV